MMFYWRENPPLIYHWREHTYKICTESMRMFLESAKKDQQNLTINWPICTNVLEFDTLDRPIDEWLKDFKVDYDLLDKIDRYPELKKMIEDDYNNY